MYYSQIRKYDTANGVGIRTTLFVSGCTKKCKGCFNAEYQSFSYGTKWTNEIELDFIEHINLPQIQGVSILGGEPMDQISDNTFETLLRNIKLKTRKNIWIYSGYTYEELMKKNKTLAILKYCDVLADGPFIEEEKDIRLAFVGSRNQRLIDVQQNLQSQKIILFKLP